MPIVRNAKFGPRMRSTEAMSVSHSGMAPYCDMASVPRIRYSPPCLSVPQSGRSA